MIPGTCAGVQATGKNYSIKRPLQVSLALTPLPWHTRTKNAMPPFLASSGRQLMFVIRCKTCFFHSLPISLPCMYVVTAANGMHLVCWQLLQTAVPMARTPFVAQS